MKSAGNRDNKLKQNPPWSRELFTISSVQGGIDTVPKYRLKEKGDVWYLHHQLQKIDEGIALPPPLSIVSEDMDYEPYEGLSHTPLRLFYRGFPMAEPGITRPISRFPIVAEIHLFPVLAYLV